MLTGPAANTSAVGHPLDLQFSVRGTGLGLAISRRLAELMGGTMRAELGRVRPLLEKLRASGPPGP